MLLSITECYVQGVHPQPVDVVVIRKIAPVKKVYLQADVYFASMDAIDHPEVLRGPSVGALTFLVQFRVSVSTD
jgi:hypothetical protein